MSTPRKVRYEPLHNGVLIEEMSPEEKTKGGIILPSTAQKKMNQGTILAVGKGLMVPTTGVRIPMDVQVGDVVTWQEYGGAQVKVDGKSFVLVRESEINGILHPTEPDEAPAAPTPDPAKEAEAKPPQPLNEAVMAVQPMAEPVKATEVKIPTEEAKPDAFAEAVAESAGELTASVVASAPKNLSLPGETVPESVPIPRRSG